MALRLVIHEVGQAPRRESAVDQLLIGRGDKCTLRIPDGSVSTLHARLTSEGGRLFVEDLGSHNKTVVEGGMTLTKGQRTELVAGMTLLLGRVRIVVENEPGPSSATELQTVAGEPALEVTLQPTLQPMRNPAPPPRPAPASDVTLQPTLQPTLKPPVVPAVRSDESSETMVPAPAAARGAAPSGAVPAVDPVVGHKTDSQTLVPSPPNELLTAQAFFDSQKPLLVIDSDAGRRAVRITPPRFTIGRSMGELAIEHQMLSNPHAQIVFQAQRLRLFVEDKQSKNGTTVNGQALIANRPQEIATQSHLKFGPIDALFLLERTYEGETLEDRRRLALKLLKLDKARLTEAGAKAKTEGIPLEAALIVLGALKVTDWVQALEKARLRLLMPDNTRGLKLVIAGLVVLLVAVVALYLLRN